jgi:hypothetical protein
LPQRLKSPAKQLKNVQPSAIVTEKLVLTGKLGYYQPVLVMDNHQWRLNL